MREENPMIKNTVQATLSSMIETLDFLVVALSPTLAQVRNEGGAGNGPCEETYTATQLAGVCNVLCAVKEAGEAGYAQAYSSSYLPDCEEPDGEELN